MEQRLFVIGLIMLVWALAAKRLNKKNLLKNKKIFIALHTAFYAITAFVLLWLYVFVKNGGESAAAVSFPSAVKTILIVLAAACWAAFSAFKADTKKREKLFLQDYDWADTIYFASLLASVVMFLFIQAFKIPSASMRNTLLEGDHLFVNKAVYGMRLPFSYKYFFPFKEIEKGDVVIFAFPSETREQVNCGEPQYGRDFVKRVIASGGDKVEIKDGLVYVNGALQPMQEYEIYTAAKRMTYTPFDSKEEYQKKWEERELEHFYGPLLRDQLEEVTVPPGSYFVMGDNRDHSCDSRFWGAVPRKNIKGRAWFIHWPPKRMGGIK